MRVIAIGYGMLTLILATGLCGCGTIAGTEPARTAVSPANLQISKDVLNRLAQDPITAGTTFGVTSQDGVVTIKGSIESEAMRARALSIVRGAPNVQDVVDRLYRMQNAPAITP